MSLVDIRQDKFAYALFRLQNEQDAQIQNEILIEIKELIKDKHAGDLLAMLKESFRFCWHLKEKNIPLTNEQEEVLKKAAGILTYGDSITAHDLKLFQQQLANAPKFQKDSVYTNYLNARKKHQETTGQEVSNDVAEEVVADNQAIVTPVATPCPHIRPVSQTTNQTVNKPPVFLEKKEYKNAHVIILHGIDFEKYITAQEKIAEQLNQESPGSIEFTRTANGCKFSGKSLEKFLTLGSAWLADQYDVFEHSKERKEKDLPEKYKQLGLDDASQKNHDGARRNANAM